ncbi:50S ribosomal protein L17 [Bergeyella sp. RCAD1439]|uniref:50S ribosomal protein L17 n=1 Tax=Bergeyella anatis TaxID=3113737 RepID=UPI002E18785F|nr:50S ribosomal protein L17 [Bergeyella sp. RCAD1439]
MRHGKKINHLGRTASHRKAMLSNMACSLIEHKRINTTVAKAKALRVYVEPLLTKAKEDTTHNRRTVFSYLQSKEAVSELFRTVAPKIADRNGGYTRIIKTGFRAGDAADMALIELVDFNELYNPNAEEKKTTRRSRRGGAKKAEAAATPAKEEVKAEEPQTEASETTEKTEE